jgi:hypothetical protein
MSPDLIAKFGALAVLDPLQEEPASEAEETGHRLDWLPLEVTEKIAGHLKGGREGLEAFRALRLSCKELYKKTFRTFALTYFTDISFTFNKASLYRLKDLARHRRFGLSFSTFPTSLTCSTYRLPTGEAVRKCLMTTSDPARKLSAEQVADAISRAYQEKPGSFGPYLGIHDPPSVRDLVKRYLESARQQEDDTTTSLEILLLAEALAALPNIRDLACYGDRFAWGQEDWNTLAGIEVESFLYMEYLVSGETNLTIATRNLLAALAQTAIFRKMRGEQLIIEQLRLCGILYAPCLARAQEPCPRGLQLHKLGLSLYPLNEVFSRLRKLNVDVCTFWKRVGTRSVCESEAGCFPQSHGISDFVLQSRYRGARIYHVRYAP